MIVAIATAPCLSLKSAPSTANSVLTYSGFILKAPASSAPNALAAADNSILSCGRFGPEIQGTTVDKSNSKVEVKTGSASPAFNQRPCYLE